MASKIIYRTADDLIPHFENIFTVMKGTLLPLTNEQLMFNAVTAENDDSQEIGRQLVYRHNDHSFLCMAAITCPFFPHDLAVRHIVHPRIFRRRIRQEYKKRQNLPDIVSWMLTVSDEFIDAGFTTCVIPNDNPDIDVPIFYLLLPNTDVTVIIAENKDEVISNNLREANAEPKGVNKIYFDTARIDDTLQKARRTATDTPFDQGYAALTVSEKPLEVARIITALLSQDFTILRNVLAPLRDFDKIKFVETLGLLIENEDPSRVWEWVSDKIHTSVEDPSMMDTYRQAVTTVIRKG